jgi:Short C-terminal domain
MRKNSKVVGMDDNGSLWIFHGRAAQSQSQRRRGNAMALPQDPRYDGIYKQTLDARPMKRKLVPILIGVAAMVFLAGCSIDLRFGGGSKTSAASTTSNNTANNNQHPAVVQQSVAPTVGQELLDLKKALDAGAITEQEYEAEKAKILSTKQ